MLRLYVHEPQVQFQARVNQSSFSYPIDQVTWDDLQTGAIGNTFDGQQVYFGTAAGLDDLGRQRLRKSVDADTVYFGRSSQGTNDGEVDLADNVFITVLWQYGLYSKIPFIDDDGTIYKDSDIEVGTNTTNPPPVANTGPPMAGTIDSGTSKLRVTLPPTSQTSFATADGASISSYEWFLPSGVTLVGGYATSDSQIEVDCDPGFYYVRLEVTDSNGATHEARVPIFARDPDDDDTIAPFQIDRHVIRPSGQEMDIRVFRDLYYGTWPDGTMVMVWEDEPADGEDRSHMVFWGWHQNDPASIRAQRTGTLQETVLNCLDVTGKLGTLPAFPQILENDDFRDSDETPSITWSYMVDPTINKYLHYLLYWHSTALEIADWTWADDGDSYPFISLGSSGASLYDQVDRRCRSIVPDHRLVCNRSGQMAVVPDPIVQAEVDRTATVQATLEIGDVQAIQWTHQRPPRVHWLYGEAVGASSSKNAAGNIPTYFCRAPGDAPGQGEIEQNHGEQLALSQSDLNTVTGHRYARVNARQTLFDIELPAGDTNRIEPADMTWVRTNISAAVAAQRRLTFANERGLVQELSIDYRQGRTGLVKTARLRWERETSGNPAVTYTPPDIEDVDDDNDTSAPINDPEQGNGLRSGQEDLALLDANGKLYTTDDFQTASGSGGPTWAETDLSTGETDHYSFVVDPFSPGYILGSGEINGWLATTDKIIYVEDFFGTPSITTQHTFDNSADGASFHWRTIGASFGRFFSTDTENPWLICVSYYGGTVGRAGIWATYSKDAGATWSDEVQIASGYDTGTPARFNPIALWLSPRTPGLAYAAAYAELGDPPQAVPYVTEDWGATWTGLWVETDDGNPDHSIGLFNDDTDTTTEIVNRSIHSHGVSVSVVGGVKEEDSQEWSVVLAPPANAVRVYCDVSFAASLARDTDGLGSDSGTWDYGPTENLFNISQTDDEAFTFLSNDGDTYEDNYFVEWTWGGSGDWPGNSTELNADPPDAEGDEGDFVRWQMRLEAFAQGAHARDMTISHTVRVTEIELDDGTIYTPADDYLLDPINRLAGTIHVPWPGNADESVIYHGAVDLSGNFAYALKRIDGTTVTDISPNDGTRDYGPNRGPFGVRSYDSDRQYVLCAGMGNGTSTSHGDDKHAVFVSDDHGDTWTNIVSAIDDSAAPTNRPAFEAAFGGDDRNVIFIWGPPDYVSYSDDFGSNVDDRSGNLSTSFTLSGALGIAGKGS